MWNGETECRRYNIGQLGGTQWHGRLTNLDIRWAVEDIKLVALGTCGSQNGGGQGDRGDQTAHVRFTPDRRRSERRKSETDLGSVGR